METATPSTLNNQMISLEAQVQAQHQLLGQINSHLQVLTTLLERQPLSPEATYALTRLRRHEIHQRLGDKDRLLTARRPELVRLVYRTARLAFLSYFSLSSYGHLPQERYEAAVNFWKEWKVPADLQAQLDQAYKDLAQDRPQLHAVA